MDFLNGFLYRLQDRIDYLNAEEDSIREALNLELCKEDPCEQHVSYYESSLRAIKEEKLEVVEQLENFR